MALTSGLGGRKNGCFEICNAFFMFLPYNVKSRMSRDSDNVHVYNYYYYYYYCYYYYKTP